MPSVIEILRHPERRRPDPAPVTADLGRIALAGTVIWLLVLAGAGIAVLTGSTDALAWVWVSLSGALVGMLGTVWGRRHPTPEVQPGSRDVAAS